MSKVQSKQSLAKKRGPWATSFTWEPVPCFTSFSKADYNSTMVKKIASLFMMTRSFTCKRLNTKYRKMLVFGWNSPIIWFLSERFLKVVPLKVFFTMSLLFPLKIDVILYLNNLEFSLYQKMFCDRWAKI